MALNLMGPSAPSLVSFKLKVAAKPKVNALEQAKLQRVREDPVCPSFSLIAHVDS